MKLAMDQDELSHFPALPMTELAPLRFDLLQVSFSRGNAGCGAGRPGDTNCGLMIVVTARRGPPTLGTLHHRD